MAPKKGSQVFLRFDSPSRGRLLQPGLVGKIWDGGWTLSFETRHQAVETGEEKLVYYGRVKNFSARWRSDTATRSTLRRPATDCSAFSTPRKEEISRTA